MTQVAAVKAWLATNRWPVVEIEETPVDGRLNLANPFGIGPRVEIVKDLPEDEQLVTLLHESAHIWLGHYKLHDSVWPTREQHMIREVEAETIAMLTAEKLGRFDVKDLSTRFLKAFPDGLVDEGRMDLIARSMATQIDRF